MSNICMDTVVFYAASDEQENGLAALRQAVSACYPAGTSVDDSMKTFSFFLFADKLADKRFMRIKNRVG